MQPERVTAYLDIDQGGTYVGAIDLLDAAGQPLKGSDGWVARCQLRTGYGGSLVATFAASGADGTVVIDNFGHAVFTLPSAFTTTMTPTTDSAGQNNRVLVADIDCWRTSAPTDIYKPPVNIRARVFPEVTTA